MASYHFQLSENVRETGQLDQPWGHEPKRHDALSALIRRCQLAHYLNEINILMSGESVRKSSSLFGLSPRILRVGSRIGASKHQRHPVILPSEHRLTLLLIPKLHEEFLLARLKERSTNSVNAIGSWRRDGGTSHRDRSWQVLFVRN